MTHKSGGGRPSSAEEALARLVQLQEAGAAPDIEAWLRDYPEFEPELRALLASRAAAGTPRALGAGQTTVAASVLYRSKPPAESGTGLEADPITLRPGARFGDFMLLRPIAQGGMGQVWEALQRPLQRIVALKFIRPDRADESAVELFAREARAAGRINDPRIVAVYATGETEGVHWIAQEYVAGECTLADFLEDIAAAGELPAGYFGRVAQFFAEVAEAMHVAHKADVVHRDLKPGNILVTPDDHPKIADFGLARLIDEASRSGTQAIVGTPHYMSPEQVAGAARAVDRRSDVFSLGAVLYQMLTLRRPFEGTTPAELFARITLLDPPDPRTIVPAVPADLAVIALKALEKRREDRYATMGELAADLRRHLADEPIRARPPSVSQRMYKWVRRHPARTVALGLAAALAVAVLGFLVQLAQKQQEVLTERKLAHIRQAMWDIDSGDLAAAASQIEAFAKLAPGDPQGDLVLAMGYARYGRMTESRAELEQARAKGYRPDAASDDAPQDLYLRALDLMTRPMPENLREAARLIERATALDADFRDAWLPLFHVRRVTGDERGAAQALASFKQSLHVGADEVLLAEALEAELDGDLDRALERFDELAARVQPDRLVELRVQRHLGRTLLALFEGRREPALLERAGRALDQALAAFPADSGALACSALVALERARASPDPAARQAQLEQAERQAEAARATDRNNVMALEVLASVALRRVMDDFDRDNAGLDPQHLAAAEARRAELSAADPSSELARGLQSDLCFFQGAGAQKRGERELALELYEQSAQAYEEQLPGRVRLGMALYNWYGQHECAREVLEEALAIWDASAAGRWDRRWLFGLLTYLVGASDRSGEVERALDLRERMLRELEDAARADRAELLTFVEFIALPKHFELKDCGEALRLLEELDLEAYATSRGGAAASLLESIFAACAQ